MLPLLQLACLSWIGSGMPSSSRSATPLHGLQREMVPNPLSNAPRLLWKASLAGQNQITLGPSGAGEVAVFAEPAARSVKGEYVSHPMQLSVFNLASGHIVWQKSLKADRVLGQAADETRFYATLQLPLASYNPFKIKPEDIRSELVAFDWMSDRELWRIPGASGANPIAFHDLVFQARSDGNIPNSTLVTTDAVTGQERWHHSGRSIHGLFAVNDLLYAYDESLDNSGPDHDPPGEYLNALDPATGDPKQRIRFYPQFRPLSSLGSLAWFPQVKRLVGTYQLYSVGTQMVEIRALDAAGKLAWNRLHTGAFQVVNDILVCENDQPMLNKQPDYDVSDGLIALDPATGHKLWQRKDQNYAGLNVWNGVIVVHNGNTLTGLDPRKGTTLWKQTLAVPPAQNISNRARQKQGMKTRTPLPAPSEFTVRGSGRYLVVAESKGAGQTAMLRVYAPSVQP